MRSKIIEFKGRWIHQQFAHTRMKSETVLLSCSAMRVPFQEGGGELRNLEADTIRHMKLGSN
jgi:hypothetical protein